MSNHLIVFVKNPVKGKVKTRLARDIGNAGALKIYQALVDKTFLACLNVSAHVNLYYSEKVTEDDLWSEIADNKYKQNGSNLGIRMKNAFKNSFQQNSKKACIIGSDCYEISEEIIGQAFDLLENSDVVIGPSQDGGYYLLGLRFMIPQLFENKPWSQTNLLDETLSELKQMNLNVKLLQELNDIDTIEDIVQPSLIELLNQ